MGNDLHVWRVPLFATNHDMSRLDECLAPDEIERAARFVFARDRNRFVAARGSLRQILAQYMGRQPQEVQFSYGQYGKPELALPQQDPRIQFNLSHSGEWALVAVARGFPVGVDIEQVCPEFATAELAAHVFSPDEQAAVAATPPQQRVAAFYKCWTSKEAYIKGLGDGLGIPLAEFDVCVRPDRPTRLLRPYHGAGNRGAWSLHDLDPGPGYAAALATPHATGRIVMREWHQSQGLHSVGSRSYSNVRSR